MFKIEGRLKFPNTADNIKACFRVVKQIKFEIYDYCVHGAYFFAADVSRN